MTITLELTGENEQQHCETYETFVLICTWVALLVDVSAILPVGDWNLCLHLLTILWGKLLK